MGKIRHESVAGGNQLAGKSCFPTSSDFKLQVPLGGGEEAFHCPDGLIICTPAPGDALFTDSPNVIPAALADLYRDVD